MNTDFKKLIVYAVSMILTVSVWSGFRSIAEPSSATFQPSDAISGVYFMHGIKISEIYPCTFNCFDMEPARDTTMVSFTTNIWLVPEKTDTLRFFGLLGANAGESGRNQFKEFLFSTSVHDDEDDEQYRIYGRMTDNSEFEIEVWGTGSRYIGAGSFQKNNTIQLEGMYQYRNRSFAYELVGVKIEELEF